MAEAVAESISAADLAETLGETIAKQLAEAMKPQDPKPDDKAPMAQDLTPEQQATITATMAQLDKAGDGTLLVSKERGERIFELLTSPEAQARLSQTATMNAGILSPIERAINPLVPNLPIGSLGLGAFLGLISGEFIDGFTPATQPAGEINWTNVVVKGVGAIAFATAGKTIMSQQAAMAAAAILTAQILADVLPLDQWIAKIRGVFEGEQRTAQEAQTWLNHHQPDPITTNENDIIGNIF